MKKKWNVLGEMLSCKLHNRKPSLKRIDSCYHERMWTVIRGGDFWDPITWRNVTDRTIRSLYSLTQFVLYVDFKWASKLAKSIYASGRRTVVLIECVLFSAKWEICWLYHGENKSGVFRAKNHDFMPKNLIFAGCAPGSTPANDISIR